ncbi:MAG: pyridoxamine 5'-phosphate oxidase family protein [Firmicutes bacterium]|nr:pyridoxamine 5'-phosphate oxidase family protein [Bacillota bacterium]
MLPVKVREMLRSSPMCILGTVSGAEPYLSLMICTFVEDEEVLVMSSRSDSRKVRNIRDNPRAAILIHEDDGLENPISMTLNGIVHLQEGQQAEKYRALHLRTHPQRSQFIEGEQITVLCFVPQRAVLADRQDQVVYWER